MIRKKNRGHVRVVMRTTEGTVLINAAEDLKTSELAPASLAILSDSPTSNDELGRTGYVHALANIILTAETPLVIAIFGGWGTGKTSMMLQLREHLQTLPSEHRLAGADPVSGTVWFDSWVHESDDNPALGLIHQAAADLNQLRDRRVRRALLDIGRATASEIQIPFVKIRVGKVIDAIAESDFQRREAQSRLRREFKSVLDTAGRDRGRIVFFIDDLDRCQPRTALRLLKSLRLFFNLEHCVFVLAIDRRHLEAAIEADNEGLNTPAESFLDKIVQLPFTIPAIAHSVMSDYVASRLPPNLKECQALLTTAGADQPRLLKRLINVLSLSHSMADKDAFADGYDSRILASIVLIQDQAPSLYDILRTDPSVLRDIVSGPNTGGSSDALTNSVDTPSTLWVKYIAPNPRLARSLGLLKIAADTDLVPYLTLASTTANLVTDRGTEVNSLTIDSILFPGSDTRGAISEALRQSDMLVMGRTPHLEVLSEIATQLREVLALPLESILLHGWSTYGPVREALDRSVSATGSEVVEVAAHRLNSEIRPHIDVVIDGLLVNSISVDVETSFEIPNVTLLVRRGEILSGTGVATVGLRCSLNGSVIAVSSRQLDLEAIIRRA